METDRTPSAEADDEDDALYMWRMAVMAMAPTTPSGQRLVPHGLIAHGLRFMGTMVAQAIAAAERTKAISHSAQQPTASEWQQVQMLATLKPWLELLEDSCHASQLSSTRGACVDSIASACALLSFNSLLSNSYEYRSAWAQMVVRLWSILIASMQDENEDIRLAAANLSWTMLHPEQPLTPFASMVCEAAVEHLATTLASHPNAACLQFLCAKLMCGGDDDLSLEQGICRATSSRHIVNHTAARLTGAFPYNP